MPHANQPHSDLNYVSVRLRLVGTRVVEPEKTPQSFEGSRDDEQALLHKRPVYEVPHFCKVHEITTEKSLMSFIGYMILLWTTWLITTIYDVRFTADSVLERCCKAIHLGVMVGFAEIGTAFQPEAQIKSVFQAMSLFLMFSRLALALQYGLVAWQIRKYVVGRRPMLLTAVIHFIAAMVYLGVSFRYSAGKSSRVYTVWYAVGLTEMALHLGFSQLSEVLTFIGTHLGERLNLLSLIVLGEGAIILAKNVTLVVKDTYLKDTNLTIWSPSLIGIVTASAALIYIIFQLYFDWMHEEHSMSVRHQVWWAALHMPFHISLVLLLEGANQFVIWARVLEQVDAAIKKLVSVTDKLPDNPASPEVSEALGDVVKPFITKYQPADVLETWQGLNETLSNISELPNYLWSSNSTYTDDDPNYIHFTNDLLELLYTMVNSIYNAFGIEAESQAEAAEHGEHAAYVQAQATQAIGQRFQLVFIYAFACAGIVLLFLIVMHSISKRKGWTPFNIVRTAVCLALALGLSLTPTISLNEAYVGTFMDSPWMLPTITLCYFVVLILSHVPHPPTFGLGKFKRGTYSEVEKAKGLRESHRLTPIPHDLHERSQSQLDTDFENIQTGYAPGGVHGQEALIHDEFNRRGSSYDNRASYVSAGSVSVGDGFDDVVDYEQMHDGHRSNSPNEWSRRH
ncbi:hypothetical protein JX265_002530 [Neoarthrinium moseri]|uniref:Uncharacterized protein n=1 Tax=Neoarthrinium moseri TaxID=1658444 RepID=A0A9P9WV74_9PEZI|nr:hypothetical protein JX265_002530 [Neoarthrinium moseri]